MATIVYLAHNLDKAAEFRARLAVSTFPEKHPRWPSVEYRVMSDYYTHVEGGTPDDCRLLLNTVLAAIGE